MSEKPKTAGYLFCSVLALVVGGCGPSEYDLRNAVVSRDIKLVEQILDAEPDLINEPGDYGTMSLHAAAQSLDSELIQLLIDRGANVNAESRIDGLPLAQAAYAGDVVSLRKLVAAGAKVEGQHQRNGHMTGTALHAAAAGGKLDAVVELIKLGADVNAKAVNQDQSTPLHDAMNVEPKSDQRKQIVELLLDHGADVNALHEHGYTPLDLAVLIGPDYPEFDPIVELLKARGGRRNRTE